LELPAQLLDHAKKERLTIVLRTKLGGFSVRPSNITLAFPTLAFPTLAFPTLAFPTFAFPTFAFPTLAFPTFAFPTFAFPTFAAHPAFSFSALPIAWSVSFTWTIPRWILLALGATGRCGKGQSREHHSDQQESNGTVHNGLR
jgi:hypothetical protein